MSDLLALARELRAVLDASKAAARIAVVPVLDESDDVDLDAVTPLFPEWQTGTAYTVGALARHDGTLYRCVQAHTTQGDWTPPAVPALWTPVKVTTGPTVDEWVQPTGQHDAYQTGDRVTFDGAVWESTIVDNVWSPSAHPAGWAKV